jgi:hypothetical protein
MHIVTMQTAVKILPNYMCWGLRQQSNHVRCVASRIAALTLSCHYLLLPRMQWLVTVVLQVHEAGLSHRMCRSRACADLGAGTGHGNTARKMAVPAFGSCLSALHPTSTPNSSHGSNCCMRASSGHMHGHLTNAIEAEDDAHKAPALLQHACWPVTHVLVSHMRAPGQICRCHPHDPLNT